MTTAQYARLRADPVKFAKYQRRKKRYEAQRRARILADPVKAAEYLLKRRWYSKSYVARVKSDPSRTANYIHKTRERAKAYYAKLKQSPKKLARRAEARAKKLPLWREKNRRKIREHQRQYREKRRAAGICQSCGRPAAANSIRKERLCTACRQRAASRMRLCREHRARARCCVYCGTSISEVGIIYDRVTCHQCITRRAENKVLRQLNGKEY